MRSFQYYIKTDVVFGAGEVARVAELVKKHGGSRVLVVYGGGSAQRSGLLERVFGALDAALIPYASIGGVQPNPRVELAREGVRRAVEFGADLILAVGGGQRDERLGGPDERGGERKARAQYRSQPPGVRNFGSGACAHTAAAAAVVRRDGYHDAHARPLFYAGERQ